MGIKSDLHNLIKSRNGGIFTHEEVEIYCRRRGCRQSNAERRLRHSESPEVETVYNKRGFIIGYKWIGEQTFKVDSRGQSLFV